ncbi:ARHGB factor, partial [Tricholaema leucomelas]|nr:ARHGB factor [Tricholaema leucomelas]
LQDPEVQKHAAEILRRMLRQEEAELQRFYEAYSRKPGSEVEEQIEGARRRLCQLQLKILQETAGGSLVSGAATWGHLLPPLPGAAGTARPGSVSPLLPGRLSLDSQDGDSGLESGPERLPSVSSLPEWVLCSAPPQGDFLFQDLAKLKSHPAHLGVFLRYIFSQADPSPLLFYLCSDVCQQSSPRDCRALAKDILSIFLDRNA